MPETAAESILFGRHAVAELLGSGTAVDTVLLADTLDEKTQRYFTALARSAGAVVKRTRSAKLDDLCAGGRHQGVAAFAAQVVYCQLDDLLEIAHARGEAPFLLLLDGVEDPHNLGALLRSALLCGVHGAVIPKRGASPVTPVVLRASAGAAAHLPIARVANLGEAVRRLKKANLFVFCADMGGTPLERQDLSGPLALVLGGEGKGVAPLVKKLCDGAISLSMSSARAGVDSFNVSVAGGILLYEAFRRRNPG
ncbi:MAG: 23S rRNA (guanosine(2251)-2'-O)-methyltransferase RlmB [Oscillospiraceae bacterium]